MRHVALVIPGLDQIGGAEKQVLLMGRGLKEREWRVSVVCLSGSARAASEKLAGIELVLLGMRHGLKDPRGWLRFARWLWHERPDVVHAHLPHAAWMMRWVRLVAPVRVVVDTIHTSATGTWGRRAGYRLSRWLPDCVTVVSNHAAENWLAVWMVSEQQMRVLPNGVEMGEQIPTETEKLNACAKVGIGDGFEWLAVGRLETVKDYPTLLRAFARLPERARLSIAGSGSEEKKLRKLACDLGVEERVRWLGFVDDLSTWLKAADGFVLGSLWEGLPVGVLEAAAIALPVVATAAMGVREALPESNAEWIAPVGDAERLSEAMVRMMRLRQAERGVVGERNFEFVQLNYSLPRILDQWEELYAELLKQNTRPRQWAR